MGYTQEELADILNLSASGYIKYENGQRECPREVQKTLASKWNVAESDLEKDPENALNIYMARNNSFMEDLPLKWNPMKLESFLSNDFSQWEHLAGRYLEYGVGDTEIWVTSLTLILNQLHILKFVGQNRHEGVILLWDGEKFAKGYNYYETYIDGGYVTDIENYTIISKEKALEVLQKYGHDFDEFERIALAVNLHSKKDYYQIFISQLKGRAE